MIINNIKIIGVIDTDEIGDRLYRLKNDVVIEIKTDTGVFRASAKKSFVTDGRSGGKLVDPLFPNWGTQLERAVVLTHDIFFYDFDISFETANLVLRETIIYIGKSKFNAYLVYWGVSTPIAYHAFGCKTDAERKNKLLCNIRWNVK